jgi:hypothetical protein
VRPLDHLPGCAEGDTVERHATLTRHGGGGGREVSCRETQDVVDDGSGYHTILGRGRLGKVIKKLCHPGLGLSESRATAALTP